MVTNKRDRAQCMVCRGDQILMIEHKMRGRDFFNLPGGGVEEGETPEEAALRELKEEALVDGTILRPLAREYKPDGVSRVFTFLVEIPDDAVPQKGMDPAEALKKFTGTYGRFADAAKYINPRQD